MAVAATAGRNVSGPLSAFQTAVRRRGLAKLLVALEENFAKNETHASSEFFAAREPVGLKSHLTSEPKIVRLREEHGRAIFGVVAGLLALALLFLTDDATHRWALDIHTAGLDSLFKIAKNAGHTKLPLLLSALLYTLGRARNNARFRRTGLLIAASVALSGLIVMIAKPVFGRMELPQTTPAVVIPPNTGLVKTLVLRIDERWGRFPSGDSTVAFSTAGALSVEFPGFAPIFLTIAALAALGRVYIGAHMASDIFAGAWLGWAVARWLARRFAAARQSKQEEILAL